MITAARLFHLDDVGAEIRQQESGVRARQQARQVENPNTV
jgi:hypothetical protein